MKSTAPARRLLAACLLVLVTPHAARADVEPVSVWSLYQRLPEPPRSAEEALQWLDPHGQLNHPVLLALKADIQAHQQALAQIGQNAGARHRADAARNVADLSTGLADAGIDMARMQRDPDYAQQVQDRIGRLSPQEMLALSQRMARPINEDRKLANAAQAQVDDEPAVQAAAAAGAAYRQGLSARTQARLAQWQAAEASALAIRSQPLQPGLTRPSPEWDHIGCEAACRAQWQRYAERVLPLMLARDTAILRVRSAALQRQRMALADEMRAADRHLVAARYGAASLSPANQQAIVGYDSSALGELLAWMDRLTDTVTSAAAVARCGPQAVLAPGTLCR